MFGRKKNYLHKALPGMEQNIGFSGPREMESQKH